MKNRVILIFAAIIGICWQILRLGGFDFDIFNSIYYAYLIIPEWIANIIFKGVEGVHLYDHQLRLDVNEYYQNHYHEYLLHWPKFLLYKRWSLLILVLIIFTPFKLKKKFLFLVLFLITHILSVISGFVILGIVGPLVIDDSSEFFLTPTLIGNLLMYIFLAIWVLSSKEEIKNFFQRMKIKIEISDRRLFEILILLLFFLILRNFLVPFLKYKSYVIFLLETVRIMSSFFHYNGYIIGDQLIGENGALALSKHCLGFMTMYLFAALIYITRPSSRQQIKFTYAYISIGLLIVFILNILRLFFVFIVAQGESGYSRASLHHEIYNILIYIVIFILWIVWVEINRRRSQIGLKT